VPVGGGCRRNKRSKSSSRSKSPATGERQPGSTSTSTVSSGCCAADMLGHLPPPPPQNLSFLPPLHHLSDYASGDIGLNFGGFQPHMAATGGDVQFQLGTSSSGARSFLSTGLSEQWRLQQFPFLANLEAPMGLLQYDQGENVEPTSYVGVAGQLRSKPLDSELSVKMEENQGLNLSRSHLGTSGNDQYSWGGGNGNGNGNAWTDISGFTSSTTHML